MCLFLLQEEINTTLEQKKERTYTLIPADWKLLAVIWTFPPDPHIFTTVQISTGPRTPIPLPWKVSAHTHTVTHLKIRNFGNTRPGNRHQTVKHALKQVNIMNIFRKRFHCRREDSIRQERPKRHGMKVGKPGSYPLSTPKSSFTSK